MKYAFCETVTAGGTTPWHIRQLTEKGPKFGGGADTKSLCGREVAWDLGVSDSRTSRTEILPISPIHLGHCCKKCKESYVNRT